MNKLKTIYTKKRTKKKTKNKNMKIISETGIAKTANELK